MRAKATVALLFMGLTACSTTSTSNVLTSPTTSSSIAPPPTATTSTLHCQIPVYGENLRDGFITFPAGTYTSAGTAGGQYYDYAVRRWLPVTRERVSPDGRHYAYTEGWSANPPTATRVHIVDAASGRDTRVIGMPDAEPYFVVDYAAGGVYLETGYEGGVGLGVWRIDPQTGSIAKVSGGTYVPAGPTWIAALDPRDPSPAKSQQSGQSLPDRIDYRDAAGQATTWLYKPGFFLEWWPFAGRHEILVLAFSRQQSQLWLVTGPDQATRLPGDPTDLKGPYANINFNTSLSDQHGMWVGGKTALYLLSPTGTLTAMFAGNASPANGCF